MYFFICLAKSKLLLFYTIIGYFSIIYNFFDIINTVLMNKLSAMRPQNSEMFLLFKFIYYTEIQLIKLNVS